MATINEIKTSAKLEVMPLVLAALAEKGYAATQIGGYEYAVATNQKDDNGNTVYVKIGMTAANTKATKTTPAFDPEVANAAFVAESAEKAAKAAERAVKHDAKVATDSEKREKTAALNAQRTEVLVNYIAGKSEDEAQSCGEIKANCTDLDENVTPMAIGTIMKRLVTEGKANVSTNGEDGRTRYYGA